MDFTYCIRIHLALFPAYVICLGSYEGSMPTPDLQRVSARTFPVIGPGVKQTGNQNNPASSSPGLPHRQGSYDNSLFVGSNSEGCQTCARSGNQDNHMIGYKPSASDPKYYLSGFGPPSVKHESRTVADAFKNVQPGSRFASTSSRSGFTSVRNLNVPEPNPLKPSRGVSSYRVAETPGSNKMLAVKPPTNTHGHMELNSEVPRNLFSRGPNTGSNSISGPVSQHYSSSVGSQSTHKLQTAGSSYGPLLKGKPGYSNMNTRKISHNGFKYTEAKPSVVSSGPILVVQGGGNAQGLGSYSGHPDSVKPPGVPRHVDPYRASQTFSDTRLTASSQGKSWNEPLHYSMSGTQYNLSPEPRKPSKSDCRDNDARASTASTGGILLEASESAQRYKLPSQYEYTRPKVQQNYNIRGQPNQIIEPMYPSQGGAQHDVTKSFFASSGAILMQAPEKVQDGAESSRLKVHTSSPERKVPFAPGQTAQYKPFQVNQDSRNVQPATSTYAGSSQTGSQAFSSVKRTPYIPSTVLSRTSTSNPGFRATKPTIARSAINTVHVRLNKPRTSSFGSFQKQWAFGDISRGGLQSSLPPSYRGQRPAQNVQKHGSSSAPCPEGVQSQLGVNTDGTRLITAIPSDFGQGNIRRISPTLSSSYRQGEQNQYQMNHLGSSASKCEVAQKSPAGFGQQSPVRFQEANLSIQKQS
ncbi:hornerin isoform X1 [Carassius auratus]|uniref:Hornerin isoform X1 n=1 Tax=Carassius auratus TaxID=7957 RepID=A0A6P6MJ87_CARAU|nr:hornerin-like isoform X1 [Carassius auratus]